MRVDRIAIAEYGREIQRTRRRRAEPAAPAGTPEADRARVRWRRLHATHAARRLPAGNVVTAAWGGLQDSAPRAALLALHARVDDVGPSAWEDPDLVQVWFRWSDYVVPRADAAVFTVGTLPRDAAQAAALEQVADAAVAVLGDGPLSTREVNARLPGLPSPFAVRMASATGRLHIRWDASSIQVIAVKRPDVHPDDARRELARRFVHWLGPVGPSHLATWAGLPMRDADATWTAIEDDLAGVSFEGRHRWVLRDDLTSLLDAERPSGVRLLPQGDPCLNRGDDQPPGPPAPVVDGRAGVTSRLVNSLTGRVVLDGDAVGAWGRAGGKVTIFPWPALPPSRRSEVAAEAQSLAEPLDTPVGVRWLAPDDV